MERCSGPSLPGDLSRSSCFVHALLGSSKGLDADHSDRDTKVHRHLMKKTREAELESEHRIPPFMTKSELSDMVLGVGELSKHFASTHIKMKVKTVMLLTKTHDKRLITYTRKLTEWLLSPERQEGYIVYVDSTFKDTPEFGVEGLLSLYPNYKPRLHWWTAELCAQKPHTFDFVMTLGGDGTVLYASWLFQKVVPPIFSFALGSLGFLTKFDFSAFEETLTGAIKDGVMIGLRLRFEGSSHCITRSRCAFIADMVEPSGVIMRSNKKADGKEEERDLTEEILDTAIHRKLTHRPYESYTVLNEIVVDRGPNASMDIPLTPNPETCLLFSWSSHVVDRALWRRYASHVHRSRWCLYCYPNRLHSLQSCSWRLPLLP